MKQEVEDLPATLRGHPWEYPENHSNNQPCSLLGQVNDDPARKSWSPLKGIRTCHPQICHFGILIILSWRQLKYSRFRKASLPSSICPKARRKFPIRKVPSQYQEEEKLLITGDGESMFRWVCTNRPSENNLSLVLGKGNFPLPILSSCDCTNDEIAQDRWTGEKETNFNFLIEKGPKKWTKQTDFILFRQRNNQLVRNWQDKET